MLSCDWLQEHEAPGGKFANGVIVRQYAPGDTVTVTSHITANHVVRGTALHCTVLYCTVLHCRIYVSKFGRLQLI